MSGQKQSKRLDRNFAPALLAWYDQNARELPWRIGPAAGKAGTQPDPYRVWLSEIMLQQTTVATVRQRYEEFLARWPSVGTLAAAPLDDVLGAWAGLGYYARARNLHKCAVEVDARGGEFPGTEEGLLALPGIGAYTAAAIAAIAFDQRAIVVDANIERVISRLFVIDTPLPASKPLIKDYAAKIWPNDRPGDFAQGLMDLGAGICKPKKPICSVCPLSFGCDAHRLGAADAYPKKAAKKPKPTRRGAVYALTNRRGEVLLERRPEKGLLGGMLGFPGTEWKEVASAQDGAHPVAAEWARCGAIAHTFTHFHLQLEVYRASAPKGFRRGAGQQWKTPKDARLPTVMKKALDLMLAQEKMPD
jgi:A/G-specific adenine glycosylase